MKATERLARARHVHNVALGDIGRLQREMALEWRRHEMRRVATLDGWNALAAQYDRARVVEYWTDQAIMRAEDDARKA